MSRLWARARGPVKRRGARYPWVVTTPAGRSEPEVDRLRELLERELARQAPPWRGCWPLLVAAAGVLLGIMLLLRWLR